MRPIAYCFALIQARLAEADELKQEGNDLFRRSKWNEALQSYRNGLTRLPKRKDPPPPASSSSQPPTTDDEGDFPDASTDAKSQSEPSDSVDVDSPLEHECAKVRSILHANIAACHLKLASAHAHSLKQFLTYSLVEG